MCLSLATPCKTICERAQSYAKRIVNGSARIALVISAMSSFKTRARSIHEGNDHNRVDLRFTIYIDRLVSVGISILVKSVLDSNGWMGEWSSVVGDTTICSSRRGNNMFVNRWAWMDDVESVGSCAGDEGF